MRVIDERGRLFGWVNVIDAAVLLLVVGILGAIAVGYSVFRLPADPQVAAVEPATQVTGPGRTLRIRGRNFLPFMRLFIQPTGASEKAIRELRPFEKVTRYVLANDGVQALLFVSNPSLAEAQLPDNLQPGTYDFVFYNETQLVAVKEAAFTLTAPPPPPPPPAPLVVKVPPPPPPPVYPRATVRSYGVFAALDGKDVSSLTVGTRFIATPADVVTPPPPRPAGAPPPPRRRLTASEASDDVAEVLSVDPAQPDIARLGAGDLMIPVKVADKMQVPASVRLRCAFTGSDCRVAGVALARNALLNLSIGGRRYYFRVEDLVTDLPDALSLTTVKVRFVAQPETAALVKVGDVDSRLAPPRDRSRQAATVTARGEPRMVSSNTQLSPGGLQTFIVQDRVVEFEATLRIPLTQIGDAWLYKGLPVKAGGELVFETFTYALRGWILTVSDAGRGGPRPTIP